MSSKQRVHQYAKPQAKAAAARRRMAIAQAEARSAAKELTDDAYVYVAASESQWEDTVTLQP